MALRMPQLSELLMAFGDIDHDPAALLTAFIDHRIEPDHARRAMRTWLQAHLTMTPTLAAEHLMVELHEGLA